MAALTIHAAGKLDATGSARMSQQSDGDTDIHVDEAGEARSGKVTRARRYGRKPFHAGQTERLRKKQEEFKAATRVRVVSSDGGGNVSEASGHSRVATSDVGASPGDIRKDGGRPSETEEWEEDRQGNQYEQAHGPAMELDGAQNLPDDAPSLSGHKGPAYRTRSTRGLTSVPIVAVAAELPDESSPGDGGSSEGGSLIQESEPAALPKRGRLRRAEGGPVVHDAARPNDQRSDQVSQRRYHELHEDNDGDNPHEEYICGEAPQTPRRATPSRTSHSRKAKSSRNTRKVITYHRPPQTGMGFAYRDIYLDTQRPRKGHKKLTFGIVDLQPAAARRPATATPTKGQRQRGSHEQNRSGARRKAEHLDDGSYNDRHAALPYSPSVGHFDDEGDQGEHQNYPSSGAKRMTTLGGLKTRADAIQFEGRDQNVKRIQQEPSKARKKPQRSGRGPKKQVLGREGRPAGVNALVTAPIEK